jgi:dipeptidyl aminopeptidase/acylaminoacyl peptidase
VDAGGRRGLRAHLWTGAHDRGCVQGAPYEANRAKYGVSEHGEAWEDPKRFTVHLQNSWQPACHKEEYAKLQALARETTGFETCSECSRYWCQDTDEHETEYRSGGFEQPWILFLTRSSSSLAGAGDGDRAVRVTELNGSFTADHPTPTHRRVTHENSDGQPVEAVVYLPEDIDPEADEPLPTIAAIHGGPMSYDAPEFTFSTAAWCSRGYAVIKPNYRGSTSYGRGWAERLKGTRGDLEADDVVSGVRQLVDDGWAHPDRLFCTGFSYGGITTGHIVTQYHDFAAAAPEHGIYDFYSNFGTDDNHTWHEWEFGLPWENLDTYRDISSLNEVDAVETPLLVTAGEEDWRGPPDAGRAALRERAQTGLDAKLVIYPGEHHGVGAPKRATHRMAELTAWFEQHDPGVESSASATE